jgi:hypothetical protein
MPPSPIHALQPYPHPTPGGRRGRGARGHQGHRQGAPRGRQGGPSLTRVDPHLLLYACLPSLFNRVLRPGVQPWIVLTRLPARLPACPWPLPPLPPRPPSRPTPRRTARARPRATPATPPRARSRARRRASRRASAPQPARWAQAARRAGGCLRSLPARTADWTARARHSWQPSACLLIALPAPTHRPPEVGAAGRAVGEKLAEAGEEVEDAAGRNKGAIYTGGFGQQAAGCKWVAGCPDCCPGQT